MGKDRVDTGRGRRQNVRASKLAKKSKSPFYAVLGLIAVLAVLLIVLQTRKPAAQAVTIDPNTPLPKAEGYLMGKLDAPVQVLEFADFECPVCSSFATLTEPDVRKRLIEKGTISFRFLDFPLTGVHRNTWEASLTAACANEQGKFWEMHDQLFETQDRWNGIATRRPRGVFKRLAQNVALDVGKWETCYDTQKYRLQIAANQKEGERRLVQATPTFVIGDKQIANILPFDAFRAYVDSALAKVPPPGSPSGDTASAKPVPRGTASKPKAK